MWMAGKTDAGLIRKANQDAYACGSYPDGNAWAVVCDGMGGANGGSTASTTAVGIISDQLQKKYAGGVDSTTAKKLLLDVLEEANAGVNAMSRNDPALTGMGTTVIACIATPAQAYIAHAGDSRAYLVGADRVVQLTRDHSVVQEMIDTGKISRQEAKNHPQRNIITRALGVEETLEVDFSGVTLDDGTYLMICTDGLTNHVEESDFVRVIFESGGEDPAAKLVQMANDGGGADNITVVILGKQAPGQSRPVEVGAR